MKFATNSTTETILPKPRNYLMSQPHQPFFLFGIIWAIISMAMFILSHKGIIVLTLGENVFHLYTLTFVVLIQFFHGFLFTTFPRFCTSTVIEHEKYAPIIWSYQVFSLLFFIGSVTSPWIVFIAMVGMLFAHSMAFSILMLIYRTGSAPIKSDPFWILIAYTFGVVSHALLAVAFGVQLMGMELLLTPVISPVVVNLFLVFMTFVVAQRMIPFFSHSLESSSERFVIRIFALLVLKTLLNITQFPLAEAMVSILLSGCLVKEFIRWKLPVFGSSAILWILHLALFWLPFGMFIGALTQVAEVYTQTSLLFSGTHLLVLGFITTVLIGFGTRVTLGHSGRPPHADHLTIALFVWTQVVVLLRFGLSVDSAFGGAHAWLFDAAGAGWIILFAVWTLRYGRILAIGR